MSSLGEISKATNIITDVLSDTNQSASKITDNLVKSLKDFSTEAIEASIVGKKLNDTQIEAILTARQYTGESLKTTAAKWKEITAKEADTIKTEKAIGTTNKLQYAYEGLAKKLNITTATLNKWVIGLSALFVVSTAVKAYVDSMRELAETTKTSAEESKAATDSLTAQTEQYSKLRQELLDANTTEERQAEIKKELLAIQKELNEKYGDEYGKVNLVTDAYRNQTDALKDLNKQLAADWLEDNSRGVRQAKEKMGEERTYSFNTTLNDHSSYLDQIKEIASKYEEQGLEIIENLSSEFNGSEYQIKLTANADEAQQVLDAFGQDIFNLNKESGGNSFILNSLVDDSNRLEAHAQKVLDLYQTTFDQARIYELASSDTLSIPYQQALDAVEQYNNAVISGDKDKIDSARQQLSIVQDSINLQSSEWLEYADLIQDIFNQADTRVYDFSKTFSNVDITDWTNKLKGLDASDLESMWNDGQNGDVFDPLVSNAQEAGLTVKELISLLQELGVIELPNLENVIEPEKTLNKTEMINALNDLSSGFEALDKIMESQKDGSQFDFSLLAEKDFEDTFSGLGKAYTDFVEIISNSPKDIKKCKSAYDNLVTEWIYSKGILDEVTNETANVTEAMLTNMGVTNASEVVNSALARQKAEVAWNSRELSNITKEEIETLKAEQGIVEDAEQAWYSYFAQKLLNETYNGAGDIEALAAVVEALGIGTAAWKRYYSAKKDLATIENSATKRVTKRGTVYYDYEENGIKYSVSEDAYNDKINDINTSFADLEKQIQEKTKINTGYSGGVKSASPSGGSSGSGSSSSDKAKQETIDWIERRNELLQKQHDITQKIADDESASYNERIEALKDLIAQDEHRAQIATESAKKYEEAWLEASKNLTNEDKQRIASGGTDIKTYDTQELLDKGIVDSLEAGEKYIDNLKESQEYYDLMKQYQEESNDLDKERIEHKKTILSLMKDEVNAQLDLNSALSTQVNSRMELMEAEGRYVGAGSYKELIR